MGKPGGLVFDLRSGAPKIPPYCLLCVICHSALLRNGSPSPEDFSIFGRSSSCLLCSAAPGNATEQNLLRSCYFPLLFSPALAQWKSKRAASATPPLRGSHTVFRGGSFASLESHTNLTSLFTNNVHSTRSNVSNPLRDTVGGLSTIL